MSEGRTHIAPDGRNERQQSPREFLRRERREELLTGRWISWYVRESVSMGLDWLSEKVAPKAWHD